MRFWLLKSEPDTFSYDDLVHAKIEPWTGIRNYQARNFLRDMRVGDLCVFYASNAKPSGAVGVCRVVREAFDDPTQFDPNEHGYDPRSSERAPRWSTVNVEPLAKFPEIVPLDVLRALPELAESPLVKRGTRLSVMPLTPSEFEAIVRFGGLDVGAWTSVPALQ